MTTTLTTDHGHVLHRPSSSGLAFRLPPQPRGMADRRDHPGTVTRSPADRWSASDAHPQADSTGTARDLPQADPLTARSWAVEPRGLSRAQRVWRAGVKRPLGLAGSRTTTGISRSALACNSS